jgi:hypothetical protein
MKSKILAVALLLLAVIHTHAVRADEAAGEERTLFGYTYERLATAALVGAATVALGYGIYVLALGGDALLGLSASAVGTIIAVEVAVHAAEAGVLGGSYYFWPADEVEDPL